MKQNTVGPSQQGGPILLLASSAPRDLVGCAIPAFHFRLSFDILLGEADGSLVRVRVS
jgi:hypothetical protein